jgi:hypothetical protein
MVGQADAKARAGDVGSGGRQLALGARFLPKVRPRHESQVLGDRRRRPRYQAARHRGLPWRRPPFGRAQVRRLTGGDRLRSLEDTTRHIPHPSLCPRCAQHLARLYLSAFVGGQAIVRPDELCVICQIRLQEFARCHRREVA